MLAEHVPEEAGVPSAGLGERAADVPLGEGPLAESGPHCWPARECTRDEEEELAEKLHLSCMLLQFGGGRLGHLVSGGARVPVGVVVAEREVALPLVVGGVRVHVALDLGDAEADGRAS